MPICWDTYRWQFHANPTHHQRRYFISAHEIGSSLTPRRWRGNEKKKYWDLPFFTPSITKIIHSVPRNTLEVDYTFFSLCSRQISRALPHPNCFCVWTLLRLRMCPIVDYFNLFHKCLHTNNRYKLQKVLISQKRYKLKVIVSIPCPPL